MKTSELRADYLSLIDRRDVTEEDIHRFLVTHPAFLPLWWPYDNTVFTKLPLGSQYVVDFAFAREDSGGVTWHLIEIEHPQFPLFTKAGNPSAKLTHALRQVLNWKSWFQENGPYVARHFPFSGEVSRHGLIQPHLHVVIGRRRGIRNEEQKLMRQLNFAADVMTFDRLAEQVSWPACEREEPLRTCTFSRGEIKRVLPLAEMRMNVSWELVSLDGKKSPAKRRGLAPR